MIPIVFKVRKMDKQHDNNLWCFCLWRELRFAAFLSETLKIYSDFKVVVHVVLEFLAPLIVQWYSVPCFGEGAEGLVPACLVVKSLALLGQYLSVLEVISIPYLVWKTHLGRNDQE